MCLLQPPDYLKKDGQETLPYRVDVQSDLSLSYSHRSYCSDRLRSDGAFAQSDLSLRWSHVPSTASGLSKQETLSYWVDVQADLSLCWSQRPYCSDKTYNKICVTSEDTSSLIACAFCSLKAIQNAITAFTILGESTGWSESLLDCIVLL